MVHWLRICLPMQGTWVPSSVREDCIHTGQLGSGATTIEFVRPRAHTPQQEKSLLATTRESLCATMKIQSSQRKKKNWFQILGLPWAVVPLKGLFYLLWSRNNNNLHEELEFNELAHDKMFPETQWVFHLPSLPGYMTIEHHNTPNQSSCRIHNSHFNTALHQLLRLFTNSITTST